MIGLSASPDFAQTAALIFEQYNQHFIVTNRLAYTAIYFLTGEINFYAISLLANLNVFVLAILYGRHASGPHRLLIVAACCALLFQLSYYRIAIWPMASLQNFTVVTLALITFLLLQSKSTLIFILAMLVAFLATFTSGSGQLILFIGALKLIIDIYLLKTTDKKRFVYWVVFTITTLLLFYTFYDSKPLLNPDLPQPIALTEDLLHKALSFFALVGSPFAFQNKVIAITTGMILIAFFIVLCLRDFRKDTALFCFALFLLASLGILAVTRSWVGIDALLVAARYRFVALNFFITLLLLYRFTPQQPGSRTYPIIAILAFSFCISTYVMYFRAVQTYSRESVEGMVRWVELGKTGGLRRPVFVDLTGPWQNLKTLYDKKIYNPDLSEYSQANNNHH